MPKTPHSLPTHSAFQIPIYGSRSACAPWLALLLLLIGQASCDGLPPPIIVFTVENVPTGTVLIAVQSSLDDQPGALQTLDVQPGEPPRFGVALPGGVFKNLQVQLTAKNSGACRSASATDIIPLPGLRFPALRSVVLTALPVSQCEVSVRVTAGVGRVRSSPAGIDCSETGGTCTTEFDESSQDGVRLIATPTTDSYFVWSRDCNGIGDCIVPLNRERAVSVAFDLRPCDPTSQVCSYSPLPSGALYGAIASDGADRAWAVGQFAGIGSALRFANDRWHLVPSPTPATLRDVWTHADSTWAVGDSGTILKWDGTQFQPVPSGVTEALFGVWGSRGDDVWMVGEAGVILHFDGMTVSRVGNPLAGERLNAIWGRGASEVWAVGGNGTILRWDGTAWQKMLTPSSFVSLVSVFGSGPDDLYVLAGRTAWRWNGQEWQVARQEGTALLHGFARSPSDVWMLRAGGQVLHFDGATWTRDQVPTAASGLTTIAPAGEDAVWVGGGGGEIHLGRGGAWVQRSGHIYSPGLSTLNEVFAVASDDVWACGDYQTLHWDGIVWRSQGPDTITCGALFGTGADDIWMLGKLGVVLHYDGKTWGRVVTLPDAKFSAGFSISKSLAYAVGSTPGVIYRWQGTSWIKDTTVGSSGDFRGVWASSAGDVWVVLNGGEVLRFNGSVWTSSRPAQPPLTFNGVSGNGPDQVFLVGDQLTRWNGSAYVNDANPLAESLRKVTALPDGTALAISVSGALIRWEGGQWSALSGLLPGAQQLAAANERDVWIVGERSRLWRIQR